MENFLSLWRFQGFYCSLQIHEYCYWWNNLSVNDIIEKLKGCFHEDFILETTRNELNGPPDRYEQRYEVV